MSFRSTLLPHSLNKPKRKDFSRAQYEMFSTGVIDLHPLCPVCKQRIYGKFHIGHIISAFHGGKSVFDNLVAVHPDCNHGTDDLTEIINKATEEERREFLMFRVVRQMRL